LAVVLLLSGPSAVGLWVNDAGDDRIRNLLLRADKLASNSQADIGQVNRYRNDVADALGESPCSPRADRLLRKALPVGWAVAEATARSVVLATPSGPMTLECS
jgi:hypothetical protein